MVTLVETKAPQIDQIIDRYQGEGGALIQVLLDVQGEYGWLSQSALRRISELLDVPLSEVYRTASFYKALSLTPRGRHVLKVCLGTACHVRGAARILDKIEQSIGIKTGETTADMRFTLERVNCLGCCALGPVVVAGNDTHGNVSVSEIEAILNEYN